MYLGIDVGTSAVKVIITNENFDILDKETVPLFVSRPYPLWSEQNPYDWWSAIETIMDSFRLRCPQYLAEVKAVGLAGQMHGAVLLDEDMKVLRPAILWNDGRSQEECLRLEIGVPDMRTITGNIAMPGFTAPKLLWVKNHEPDVFSKINKVLLPKDFIRFCFTGDCITEMSDASGTLWLNVKERKWSEKMLSICGLGVNQMPDLCEGSDQAGKIRPDLAKRWGLSESVVFAGGAGDNAAGAVGIGAVGEERTFISMGTSGVYFVASDGYHACPQKTVHSFCHALPNKWHQMGVILSAASCIKTASQWFGEKSEVDFIQLLSKDSYDVDLCTVFLPYLSGERTPHNNPQASGVFFGLTHSTNKASFIQSVLEGVAFAFADCQSALYDAGVNPKEITLIGGGSRSKLWGEILATVLNKPIVYVEDGDQGPAFGGAKLAALCYHPERATEILAPQKSVDRIEPNQAWREGLSKRLSLYRSLYQQVKPLFK